MDVLGPKKDRSLFRRIERDGGLMTNFGNGPSIDNNPEPTRRDLRTLDMDYTRLHVLDHDLIPDDRG